jgi:hypothetical protein
MTWLEFQNVFDMQVFSDLMNYMNGESDQKYVTAQEKKNKKKPIR